MRYIPHTDQDVARLLEAIGAPTVDALFAGIPSRDRLSGALDMAAPLSESEVLRRLGGLAAQNAAAAPGGPVAFLGAGAYRHGIPHALDQLLRRAEFLTAYTPYQPEISQGTLQSIFEFQSVVTELFALDVANASMYDGATAAGEALLMAHRLKGKERVVISAGLHPEYRETCATLLHGLAGSEVVTVPLGPDGRTDAAATAKALAGGKTAALLVQSPNFLGVVEDLTALADLAHAHDALAIAAVTEVVSLGMLKPPGAAGCDIAVGDGLGFALPVTFGGPGVGLIATRDANVRQMPGRLVGETVDAAGVRGFVLTLATREQHIRREKATSNICSNQGLVALAFTIQASLLGRTGLPALAKLNHSKAEYLKQAILALPGYGLKVSGPTFNEFAVKVPGGDAAALAAELAKDGILAGVPLGRFEPAWRDTLLVNVTELHRREDLDALVAALAKKGGKR
jgi:glycine dehydrogenase subunit 1